MRKEAGILAVLLSVAILGSPFFGCEREGPAERAGEKVDESTEEAGETLEEAGEDVQDTAD